MNVDTSLWRCEDDKKHDKWRHERQFLLDKGVQFDWNQKIHLTSEALMSILLEYKNHHPKT